MATVETASTTPAAISSAITKPTDISITTVKSSPLPTRLVKLLKDEEWISGSELRTDNSSSDDELSPSNASTTAAGGGHLLKVKKLKIRKKKQILDETRPNPTIKPQSDSILEQLREKLDLGTASEDECDIVWRPKRGSISLIGLESEFNKIK